MACCLLTTFPSQQRRPLQGLKLRCPFGIKMALRGGQHCVTTEHKLLPPEGLFTFESPAQSTRPCLWKACNTDLMNEWMNEWKNKSTLLSAWQIVSAQYIVAIIKFARCFGILFQKSWPEMIFLVNTSRHSEVTEDEINSIRRTIDGGSNNTSRGLGRCCEKNPHSSFPWWTAILFNLGDLCEKAEFCIIWKALSESKISLLQLKHSPLRRHDQR